MTTQLPNLLTWSADFGNWAGQLDFLTRWIEDLAADCPAPLDDDSLGAARLLPAYVNLAQWHHRAHTAQIAMTLAAIPEDYAISHTLAPHSSMLERWAQADPGQEPPRPVPAVASSLVARLAEQLLTWSDGTRLWHDWLDTADTPLVVDDLKATILSIWLTTAVPAHQRTFARLTAAADRVAEHAERQLESRWGGR